MEDCVRQEPLAVVSQLQEPSSDHVMQDITKKSF